MGDPGLIPGLGKSPEEGNGNPLQYSWLENPMESGGLQSMGLQKVGYDWGAKTLIFWQRKAVFDKWPTSTVSVGIQEGSKNNILDVIQERLTMIDFLDTIER